MRIFDLSAAQIYYDDFLGFPPYGIIAKLPVRHSATSQVDECSLAGRMAGPA